MRDSCEKNAAPNQFLYVDGATNVTGEITPTFLTFPTLTSVNGFVP